MKKVGIRLEKRQRTSYIEAAPPGKLMNSGLDSDDFSRLTSQVGKRTILQSGGLNP